MTTESKAAGQKRGVRYARAKAREWMAARILQALDSDDLPVDDDSPSVQDEFRHAVCVLARRLWPETATAHQDPFPERRK